MARRRSTRPSRDRWEEGAHVEPMEAAPLEFDEPERPARVARGGRASGRGGGGGGGMLGIGVPLVTAVLATICVIVGGFLTASKAKSAMSRVFDQAGMNAVIALTAVEPDWWETNHGLTRSFYESFVEKKNKRKKDKRKEPDWDKRDDEVIEKKFKQAVEDWKLDPKEMDVERDNLIRETNQIRLRKILPEKLPGSGILYAAIREGSANGRPIRNVTDRINKVRAVAMVVIDTRPLGAATSGLSTGALIAGLIALLVVGGAAFVLCMGPAKGIGMLTRDVEQIARGDLDTRVSSRAGGEVGNLARMVERAMKTFRAVQEQSIAQASAAPVAMEAVAGVDSSSLLPGEPPRVDGYEIEGVHKACPDNANDFHDFIQVDDTHIGVVVADMPHAGPAGTFSAATFRALMRAFGIGETSPSVVLARVNRVMAGELKRGDHITAMYCVLDTEKDILAVASAGHLPLVFWKLEKKGSALLNPEGIAIGLDKGPVFEKTVVDKRIKLDKGDRIALYTDGAVAAVNADGEEYGEQRFYYAINREAPKNSAAFVNFVANEIDLFHEGAVQHDDITLVTVRKVG